MKIHSITNFQYKNLNNNNIKSKTSTNYNQDNLINFAYMDFNFKGLKRELIRPQFNTVLQEKIANKISTCFKILPEKAKLSKPIVININNNVVEFLMDRSLNTGLTNVSIKMLDENNKESSLNMSLDKNGQLRTGIYYDSEDLSTSFAIVNNSRNVYYGDAKYKLINEKDSLWSRLSAHANETFSPKALQIMKFNKTELQEMLSIMASKNYSFLAK